uniref:Uncharacterized protein n=1 Tax=Rhizophora mucronata TaxID=61149 RepID=A0A2P2QI46_RHIMU
MVSVNMRLCFVFSLNHWRIYGDFCWFRV